MKREALLRNGTGTGTGRMIEDMDWCNDNMSAWTVWHGEGEFE